MPKASDADGHLLSAGSVQTPSGTVQREAALISLAMIAAERATGPG
jgi:hypothetical protein